MGQKLRELRLVRGIAQGEMARRLGISPAYLSLIEKGVRSVQLPILWRALEAYGVSMEAFMASVGETRVDDALRSLLDEPLLRSLELREEDVALLSRDPKAITTITALFNLYKTTRSQLEHVTRGLAAGGLPASGLASRGTPVPADAAATEFSPFDEVTEFLERHDNWFAPLEERAAAVHRSHDLPVRVTSEALRAVLLKEAGVTVEFTDPSEKSSVVRRFDARSKALTVSSHMPEQRLRFQLAHTLGLALLERENLHGEYLEGANFAHGETAELVKIHLANYLAGAVLLSYDPFFREAERCRYDVEYLARTFDSSYETVAHRLCNLADPKRRGVPFQFVRADVAGNVSKRYAPMSLGFPRERGSCPKNVVHLAYLTPNVVTKQYEVFPDGAAYFWFAKVVSEPLHGSLARGTVYSIGLGTHADEAKRLAYADDLPFADPRKMAIPVGPSCRFCERTDCNQRAAPSYKFAFKVDPYTKKDNFFSPLVRKDDQVRKDGEP